MFTEVVVENPEWRSNPFVDASSQMPAHGHVADDPEDLRRNSPGIVEAMRGHAIEGEAVSFGQLRPSVSDLEYDLAWS
jgi:hypothetical protein